MDANDLMTAIRQHLDNTERLASGLVGDWTAITLYPNRGEVVHSGRAVATTPDHETAEHIARHDPAAVLRQVAAERRVLERHRPVEVEPDPDLPWISVVRCAHCGDDWRDCPEIRDLADRLDINP